MSWLKKAFTIPKSNTPPTAEQQLLIDSLATEIVRRQLEVPAIGFLEMARPLRSISLQGLYSAAPFIDSLFSPQKMETLQQFLARTDSIDRLCTAIEAKLGETTVNRSRAQATVSQ